MVEKFTSHLRVDKQIVSLLSKSTYQKSFANAIRELVSNAYDADALLVNISIEEDYIEVFDDGNGMTKKEFERYLTIAGTKSLNQLTRRYKRKRIGQFGVGFLSIFPFCESLEITTTSENTDEILNAKIPTRNFFDMDKNANVEDIPIKGSIVNNSREKTSHYTRIRLVNPTHLVKQYFTRPNTNKRDSIITWDPFERFQWELQEDLPISYNPDSKYFTVLRYKEPIGMTVSLNGESLYRNDLSNIVLQEGEESVEGIECKYVFTTGYKSIKPMEARGIKIRVNNVGIGARTDFSLKRNRGFSRLHWINGDILISEKIKEHLNVSREGFISSPLIEDITEFFAAKLSKLAYFIEDVSEAEKELESTLNQLKSNSVKPKSEVINSSLSKLEKKGFKILKSNKTSSSNTSKKPFIIDKTKKTVTIFEAPDHGKDFITVLKETYEIEYANWDHKKSDFPACRFKRNSSIIEINQSYPLFKSRSHGNIFKKISLLLLLARENNRSSKDMFNDIAQNLTDEFSDLI